MCITSSTGVDRGILLGRRLLLFLSSFVALLPCRLLHLRQLRSAGGRHVHVRRAQASEVQLRPSYVSVRQRTSAYVSIRQHTSAYVCIREQRSAK